MIKKIILATTNKKKIREFNNYIVGSPFALIAQSELGILSTDETGLTFIENAIIKARHASEKTGLPAMADDSGLLVDALNGAPGIYSARYAGENVSAQKNCKKVLDLLKNIPRSKRMAQFHCILTYIRHANDPIPIISHGAWIGQITTLAIGQGGFGYDSIFYLPELGCTAAELTIEEKMKFSHRSKAMKLMLKFWLNA